MEDGGVAVVTIDVPGEKMNTLCAKMTDDFAVVLDKIDNDESIKSVVLISGKPDNFIAGADIKQLSACESEEELEALSTMGQKFMDRMSDNKRPFVAAIHGPCLGGGLEVALACDYRIATEHKKTQMALPEVMLGLLPGAGGTQRLPALVGLQKALPMVLTGKTIRPKQAKSMGLVNQLADPYALEAAAIQAARGLADGSLKASKKKKGFLQKLLEDNSIGQWIVFNEATKMVDKNAKGKYPAPYKILDAVKAGLSSGHAAGSKVEAKGFSELGMTSESKALVSIFFGQTAAKKNEYGKPEKGKEVNTVAVIGAGLMGAGIAQVSAMKGFDVLLKDMAPADVSKGESAIRANLEKRVKKRAMTSHELDITTSRVVPLAESDVNWPKHMGRADMVIEAVPEIMSLKHKIIQAMEEHIPDHCIIATNTSALPIEEIASASKRPENVIGMHYFSPVPQMPLLEIITHPGTSNETASRAVDVGIRQGKTCIVVKDVPGFYVNRCLGPFLAESMAIIEAGTGLEALDKAMKVRHCCRFTLLRRHFTLLCRHCTMLCRHCTLLCRHCTMLCRHCTLLGSHCTMLCRHCTMLCRHFTRCFSCTRCFRCHAPCTNIFFSVFRTLAFPLALSPSQTRSASMSLTTLACSFVSTSASVCSVVTPLRCRRWSTKDSSAGRASPTALAQPRDFTSTHLARRRARNSSTLKQRSSWPNSRRRT
jgi:enoyl-CoA hydratase/long-chain 3-hydroxyacyl-CoA dehydrogenase